MAEEQSVFKKIASAVGTYAPGIASVLALIPGVGTLPAAAIGAVGILAKSLGMPSTAKPEDILATIQSMPDSELKLKFVQAEQAFQISKRDQDIKELQINLADTQNARGRQIEHEKITGKPEMFLYVLSTIIVLGFLAIVGVLLFVDVPSDQTNVLYALLGTLGTGFIMVLQYYFGSNKSSNHKTAMIYNSTPNQPKADVDK